MIIITIKVVPSSGRIAWKFENDILKCYLKSPPEQGKANRELMTVLAKALGISAQAVTIVQGATARIKKVRIDGPFTFEAILAKVGVVRQMSLFSPHTKKE